MISPQQPATTAMGELTWAQVMPAEKYWRERIAKEIEGTKGYECHNWSCNVLDMAIYVAKGLKL